MPSVQGEETVMRKEITKRLLQSGYKNKLIPRELDPRVGNFECFEYFQAVSSQSRMGECLISNVMGKMGVSSPEGARERAQREWLFQQRIFH